MRQVSLIGLVSVLALFVSGCPGGNEGGGTGSVTPTPTTPTPVASPVAPKPSPSAAAQPFDKPLAAKQPAKPVGVTGLLQTLPPEARVTQIPKGRTDPFAAIPVQPQIAVSPNAETTPVSIAARPVPTLPQLPSLRGNQGTGRAGTQAPGAAGRNATRPAAGAARPGGTARPNTAARPGGTARPNTAARPGGTTRPNTGARPGTTTRPGNTPPPLPAFIPELPRLPEPTLARGVEVTGVIDVAGVPNAIVRVPNEPSRYVQAGQRISNGQVLVKRIEMNRGPTPVVVLEQYGIEVAKQVGEKPVAAPGQPGSPTAIIPPPPPLS